MQASPRKRLGGATNTLGPGTSPSYMMELPITPVAVRAEEVVILSPADKGFPKPLSKGGSSSSRHHHVPPFHSLEHKGPAKVVKRARNAQELVRAKKLLRALGFFYHLSLGVLFTTFTELLLNDFDNNFAKTAAFLGTCAGVERGVQFFTSPFLGNLSDSIGRRPILLSSLLLHLASLLAVAIIPTRRTVFAYFVVNGGSNVTFGMVNAIVADLCTAQAKTGEGELAQQYGKLGMAVGLSMILGYVLFVIDWLIGRVFVCVFFCVLLCIQYIYALFSLILSFSLALSLLRHLLPPFLLSTQTCLSCSIQ